MSPCAASLEITPITSTGWIPKVGDPVQEKIAVKKEFDPSYRAPVPVLGIHGTRIVTLHRCLVQRKTALSPLIMSSYIMWLILHSRSRGLLGISHIPLTTDQEFPPQVLSSDADTSPSLGRAENDLSLVPLSSSATRSNQNNEQFHSNSTPTFARTTSGYFGDINDSFTDSATSSATPLSRACKLINCLKINYFIRPWKYLWLLRTILAFLLSIGFVIIFFLIIHEFIIALGFLLVLLIERIVLECNKPASEETVPLLSSSGQARLPRLSSESSETSRDAQDMEKAGHHFHVDFNAHSSFRCLILILSLSLHSVFEGLAIGLQNTQSEVLQIAIAILVHKSIIAVSLSLLLMQSALKPCWFRLSIGIFAVMSPLGIGLGVAVMQNEGLWSGMVQCVLEGLAAGTFVYITFLEILPHELNSSKWRLPKLFFIVMGFSLMTGLRFLG